MASHLLFLLFLLSEAASEPVVKVEPGQDVILPCRAGDVTIRAVEWTRSDLVDPNYVLLYSDGQSDPTYQNSSFTGRVQLVDGELKTGDVSMILKDVKREDSGTYECRVQTAASRRKKRAAKSEPISIVELQVTENNKGDNKDGHNGDTDNIDTRHHVGLGAVVVSLLVCLVAAAAAVGLFLVRKSKRPREKKPEPSADEETGDNLL
ncbi:hepatitis A virus cellular receptor 2 homolog [Acanthopagrus latus]|uniref:hepatitis A virus cellular receptor 2 homolog n=1 Tax=Acanthopagrus latus TaxID=8177 RepID=UPI00187BF35D|nr:hepatitis A virus cellular receptor 2 homolog [Acanthopagrus latus]